MARNYTSKDILEMAVQAKGKSVELYLALAHNSENYHVARLFMELAKDEQKHKHELEKWLEYLAGSGREEAYPGERSLYLRSLVETNTYNCGTATKRALEKTIDEEDALKAGITFEKDFMLFLHELKASTGKDGKETVDALIEDEIRHLRDMFDLKDKLGKIE